MRFRPLLPYALCAAILITATTAFQQRDNARHTLPSDRAPISQSMLTSDVQVEQPSLVGTDVEPMGPVASIGNAVIDAASVSLAAATAVHLEGNFRLDVPFKTQKDGARFQGANCGPANLAMVLLAHDVEQTNSDLRWLIQGYMGNQGARGGTALHDIASVGRDFGLTPIGIYDGANFARWTVADVEEQLRLGNPVIALVKYRLLPDYMGSTVRYDHYIVIHGIRGDRFLYHDSAQESPSDGAGRWITAEQLGTAMHTASIPGQAVAFASGRYSPLAYRAL